MAWGSVSVIASANNKTAGTTVVMTTALHAIPVGNVILVVTGWDNTDTTDINPTRLSVTDSNGNTYVRVREFVNGQGASNAGAHVGIFYAIVTTQLANGGTITVTNNTSKTARACTAWEFTLGAGSTISAVSPVDLANDGADPGSMTISGLSSAERLYLRGYALEADVSGGAFSPTTNFTGLNNNGTTGGGNASNMSVGAEFRINTSTGETSDPTDQAADCASIFVALVEVPAATFVPRATPYPQLLAH